MHLRCSLSEFSLHNIGHAWSGQQKFNMNLILKWNLNSIINFLNSVFDLHLNWFKFQFKMKCRLKLFLIENKEEGPVQPVQMNIYQNNNYRKDLSWLHFNDEPTGSWEAASEGSTVQHISFCSLSKIPSSS